MALPTWVADGTKGETTTVMAPALPAGIAVNDILLLFIETANGAITITTPNGGTWTEVTNSPQGTGVLDATTATRLTVFWSRYNGTQTAPVTSDPGDHAVGYIGAYRGCTTSDPPYNITSGNVDAVSDASLSATGATTTVADCLIVIAAAIADDSQDFGATWTNADLANITVRQNSPTSVGTDGRVISVNGEKATAGTYGATTNTLTSSSLKGLMTIALAPPSGAQQDLTGSLFTKAPTFFTGAITATYNLAGALFTKAPTFNTGTVTAGAVTLTGSLFTKTPTFPTGIVAATYSLTGNLFQKAPTFPQGAVTSGALVLNGTLFVKAPIFPQGAITTGPVSLTGVLFQKAPTFPTGTVTAGAYPLTGVLFVKAPTFFTGTIGQAGTLFGNLFVKAPTFFTGTMGQLGGSFWRPNPVSYTLNPVAFTPVGPNDVPPWAIEIHGTVFVKAPTFPVGAVS